MFSINIRQRWVFAVLCFLGTLHSYAMRNCLPITLTEMVIPTTAEESSNEDTCPSVIFVKKNATLRETVNYGKRFAWSDYTQGFIFSSIYYSLIVMQIPAGRIALKYGGKHILGLGILLTSVFTLLIPSAIAWADSNGLIAMRFLIGLAQGFIYPSISVLVSNWIPLEERSRVGTLICSGEALGTVYGNFVGGLILNYFKDWTYVFHLIGCTGAVWYIAWLALVYNNPREHPFISESEKVFLHERLSEHLHEKKPPVPWRHILRSKPVWAAIITLIGFNWSLITMTSYLPTYLSFVLKFSIQENGNLTSLVCICMWFCSIIASWLMDYAIGRKIASITNVRKFGSVLSLTVSASFIVGASHSGCDKPTVILMFAIAMSLLGISYSSLEINALDLSPNYSGVIMALSNGIGASLAGVLSPYVISVITLHQTLQEWSTIFWILFMISLSANVIFLVIGSAEVQYWNNLEFDNSCDAKKYTEGSSDLQILDVYCIEK